MYNINATEWTIAMAVEHTGLQENRIVEALCKGELAGYIDSATFTISVRREDIDAWIQSARPGAPAAGRGGLFVLDRPSPVSGHKESPIERRKAYALICDTLDDFDRLLGHTPSRRELELVIRSQDTRAHQHIADMIRQGYLCLDRRNKIRQTARVRRLAA